MHSLARTGCLSPACTAMHQDAGLGMERTGWIFSFPLKGLYAVHNMHNCKQQPCLGDSCVIYSLAHTHTWTNRNMGQAEAERWISLKNSTTWVGWVVRWVGGWTGREVQIGREGCLGVYEGACTWSLLLWNLFWTLLISPLLFAASSVMSSCTHKDMASPKQNVGTFCLHCQLRPDCWVCPWAQTHTCLRTWWSFCLLWNVWLITGHCSSWLTHLLSQIPTFPTPEELLTCG